MRVSAVVVLVVVACAPLARAQDATAPDVSAGVYTAAQAARGERGYADKCVHCHGPDLRAEVPEQMARDAALIARGAIRKRTPALVGETFLANWNGLTVGKLLERIHVSMPQEAPGSMTTRQAADVLAFMLQRNGYPAGETELPPDTRFAAVLRPLR